MRKYLVVLVIFGVLFFNSDYSIFLKSYILDFVYKNLGYELTMGEPKTFKEAKHVVKKVYKGNERTFYCGCDYEYRGDTGGVVDLESCGYEIRANKQGEISDATIARASRIEYEHIFPASWYGRNLKCWKDGGRKGCANDKLFNKMESDVVNLVPAVGQINGDRSNYHFVETGNFPDYYGDCESSVDFSNDVAFAPEFKKGEIGRIMMYMYQKYGFDINNSDYRRYEKWHLNYPVTEWEYERNQRIKKIVGYGNDIVDEAYSNTSESQNKVVSNEIVMNKGDDELYDSGNKFKKDVMGKESEIRKVYKGIIYADKGGLVYYYDNCYKDSYINKTNLTYFDKEDKAIEKGYKKSKRCH